MLHETERKKLRKWLWHESRAKAVTKWHWQMKNGGRMNVKQKAYAKFKHRP
jgi:hypothetical protein